MGREKYLFDLAMGHPLFGNGGQTGAQQIKAGFTTMGQFLRMRYRRLADGDPELGCGGVVHQQEAALLVLNRHTGGQQLKNFPQNIGLDRRSESAIGFRRGGRQLGSGAALHNRGACRSVL